VARQVLGELARTGVPNYFGEQRFGKRGSNLEKGLRILRGHARAMARAVPRRVFGLLVSAVQSEAFNRVVIRRLATLGTLLPGDLAFLKHNGACFPVADPAREQPRAELLEISPSGPMPGPKMTQPQGEVLAIEQQVLAHMELLPQQFAGLPFGVASGERRPLRVPVRDVCAEAVPEGLRLSFTLPRGSFATAVLRELLVDTIWFAEG
jgi:tRNA pseudouridine13 synthase